MELFPLSPARGVSHGCSVADLGQVNDNIRFTMAPYLGRSVESIGKIAPRQG